MPQDATAVATKCSHSSTQHSLANERHDSVVAGSCSKSSWDLPLVEGPGRQVHPKTTTFCLVLGFTPSTQPSRAHQSQNDFEQRYSGTSVVLQGGLYALPDLVSPLPFPVLSFPSPFRCFRFFLTCNVGKKNGLPLTFSSGRVTSGNCQPAFQAHLWHFPVFRTCNVRKKIGLPRTFSSGRVTSGTAQRAFLCSYSSCSKSFGESTPHRDACRAHRSPNSPISPRLVRPPSLEGTARHIVHQTIWHKASERCHRALFG